MLQVNIQEAQARLSTLVDLASEGEPFIIVKAGKPMAKVIPYDFPQKQHRRIGFLKGQFEVPDDLEQASDDEVIALFEGAL
ncbi:MAG: type II toxin-antitoxin system prevent-host-death family antitoxin [Defluviitaleaceae bacterium]|nr:type II toxin-antitoxin system prevent-host-death family antitoxin [Defluviitaleaceae bacterium]